MGNLKSIENIKEITNEFLANKLSPNLIILFGSAANGTLREDSDVDIAFLSSKNIEDYDIFMLGQELAEKLERDVDLIDLKKAYTVFKT